LKNIININEDKEKEIKHKSRIIHIERVNSLDSIDIPLKGPKITTNKKPLATTIAIAYHNIGVEQE
jgi:hypothetical protein